MQNFINELINNINFDGKIETRTVIKNNGQVLTGLMFVTEGSNISPTIYAEQFYPAYESGNMTIEDIAREIERVINENAIHGNFNLEDISKWEKIKDDVLPILLDKNANKELLKDMVYTKTETDLVECYMIKLQNFNNGLSNVKIKNGLFEALGITKDELKAKAHENATRNVTIKSMTETLMEIMEISEEDAKMMGLFDENNIMWVVSNKDNAYGAGAMFVDDVLDKIATKTKKNEFYILPSSIHEFIVVTDMSASSNELKNMVMSVNGSEVSIDDKLSDGVYKFDGETVVQVA